MSVHGSAGLQAAVAQFAGEFVQKPKPAKEEKNNDHSIPVEYEV